MRLRRQAAAFALLLTVAVPMVASAEPRPAVRGTQLPLSAPAFVSHLWGFLTSLWEAEGTYIDPWGSQSQTPDAGAYIDPLGSQSQTPDAGAYIDPWGATTDAGVFIDPLG